jgi:hypothetical protein
LRCGVPPLGLCQHRPSCNLRDEKSGPKSLKQSRAEYEPFRPSGLFHCDVTEKHGYAEEIPARSFLRTTTQPIGPLQTKPTRKGRPPSRCRKVVEKAANAAKNTLRQQGSDRNGPVLLPRLPHTNKDHVWLPFQQFNLQQFFLSRREISR